MKKRFKSVLSLLICLLAICLQPFSVTASAATSGSDQVSDASVLVSYTIDKLGLTLGAPAIAYSTDADVADDFPLLDVYGVSASQLTEKYNASGICFNAIWYDKDADVTEIVVSTSEDQTTRSIFNLGLASDSEMRILEDKFLNYTEKTGAHYDAVSTVEHAQTRFIMAKGSVSGAVSQSNHLQYMTIVNGVKVEITLIEHFGVTNEYVKDNTPWIVSAAHEQLMARIVASARWRRIESAFLARNRTIVFFCFIGVISAAALITISLLQKKKGDVLTISLPRKTVKPDNPDDQSDDSPDAQHANMPEVSAPEGNEPDDGNTVAPKKQLEKSEDID